MATYCVRGTASGYTAKHGKTQGLTDRSVWPLPLAPPTKPLGGAGCKLLWAEAKQSPAASPNSAWDTGWQVPGLALPPSTELLNRLRTGQGVAVAVVHLDAVIANTHGVG